MRLRSLAVLSLCLFALSSATHAQSTQASAAAMSFKPAATAQFANRPALPSCVKVSVQHGNPEEPGAFILLKIAAGCVIPWHWHTSSERVIFISGSARAEMRDGPSVMLHAGDFLLMPPKHIHQFQALTDVELYNVPDGPFDIHYVDANGKEIPRETALQPH